MALLKVSRPLICACHQVSEIPRASSGMFGIYSSIRPASSRCCSW